MSENMSSTPMQPGQFPLLFGASENVVVRERAQWLRSNETFAASLIPSHSDGTYSALDKLVIRTCGKALTEADYKFGRHTGELGELQARKPHGIWAKFAMPTFYHNGDGTRLAMIGTASYMDFVNQTDPESPYKDRKTYLASLLTAAYDDIVFGEYGRGGDERRSIEVAQAYMEQQGFPAGMIEAVSAGIEASIFNEKTSKQNIDPARGYLAVQVAGNVGDLWALGTSIGSMNAGILAVENLWKYDTKHDYNQVLHKYARALYKSEAGWKGKRLPDFLKLIQQDPESYQHFGAFFSGNEKFLSSLHRYPDARVDDLMQAGKEQNGILQGHIGRAILSGSMDVHEGFRCAVGYATLSDKQIKSDTFSTIRMERLHRLQVTPLHISRLILKRRKLEVIQKPLPADDYFDRYNETLK